VHRTNQCLYTLASSKGRGNRATGWFADCIANQGDDQMESLALAEGVKGWATAGPDYVQHMIEYNTSSWL
jgi:arsenical-resistance protein 2